MKVLAPGLRELGRMAARLLAGGRLLLDRRRLARLETALGLLGWQQAEYDTPTQEHVNRLNAYEREQARLTNESALLGIALKQIEEQRVAQREKASDDQRKLIAAEKVTAANRAELQGILSAVEKKKKSLEARLPVLDREFKEAERRHRERSAAANRPEAQTEVARLYKLAQAIPRERDECKVSISQAGMELAAMEKLTAEWDRIEAQSRAADEELGREAAAKMKEKRRLEKQAEELEKEKEHPYRVVGQALADNRIEPLNQPEALAAVLEQRSKIEARLAGIEVSRAASATEVRREVWQGWGILAGVALLILLVILAIAR